MFSGYACTFVMKKFHRRWLEFENRSICFYNYRNKSQHDKRSWLFSSVCEKNLARIKETDICDQRILQCGRSKWPIKIFIDRQLMHIQCGSWLCPCRHHPPRRTWRCCCCCCCLYWFRGIFCYRDERTPNQISIQRF